MSAPPTAETLTFYRVLLAAPGRRALRLDLVREVAKVIYPSRAFQSQLDLRRRDDPHYPEPKQGTRAWSSLLEAGQQRLAAAFVTRMTHYHGPQYDHTVAKDGDYLALTDDGVALAESLAEVSVDAGERWRQTVAEKYVPSIDVAELLRPLNETEYDELRESIRQHGQLSPIVVDDAGMVIDGRHRQQICDELGLAPVVTTIPWNTSGDDKIAMALSLNTARRQVSIEERDQIMLRFYREHEWSMARIATVFHVDRTTVSRRLAAVGVTIRDRRVTADGRVYRSTEERDEIRRRRVAGESVAALAHDLGATPKAIERLLSRNPPTVHDARLGGSGPTVHDARLDPSETTTPTLHDATLGAPDDEVERCPCCHRALP